MTVLKIKGLKEMGKDERTKKLKELKLELIKAKSQSSKGGSAKIKGIKKIIARIYTLDKRPKDSTEKLENKVNKSKKILNKSKLKMEKLKNK